MSATPTPSISITNQGHSCRIRMIGEADIDFVNAFSRIAQELEQKSESTVLVVDMKDVTYIDSASLGIFVKLIKIYQSRSNKIIIFKPKPPVLELFQLTGLSRMITICDTAAGLDALTGTAKTCRPKKSAKRKRRPKSN